jgi:hypothetical protein
MITNIKTRSPKKLVVAHKFEKIDCVIPATIDAKIMSEIPLEIPFSVISSPIRMTNIDPTAKTKADNKTIQKLLTSITFPPPDEAKR